MIPNLTEILITAARNRKGVLFDRFGDDFPFERYEYLVSIINPECDNFDQWFNYVQDAINIIENGYSIYKVFK